MSLLRELLLSRSSPPNLPDVPDVNRRHARAGLTLLRFFLDDRVDALRWFVGSWLCCVAAIRPKLTVLTVLRYRRYRR